MATIAQGASSGAYPTNIERVAARKGLEPLTLALGKPCSIRLSYRAARRRRMPRAGGRGNGPFRRHGAPGDASGKGCPDSEVRRRLWQTRANFRSSTLVAGEDDEGDHRQEHERGD